MGFVQAENYRNIPNSTLIIQLMNFADCCLNKQLV